MKNLVYFCFAVIMAAIAYSIIPHSAMGDVAATVKYCDRNAAKAVSNAVANVEFMLPGLVTNQVNEFMADKYVPHFITNTVNNIITNDIVNIETNISYEVNQITNINTYVSVISNITTYVNVVTNFNYDYSTNIAVNIATNYSTYATNINLHIEQKIITNIWEDIFVTHYITNYVNVSITTNYNVTNVDKLYNYSPGMTYNSVQRNKFQLNIRGYYPSDGAECDFGWTVNFTDDNMMKYYDPEMGRDFHKWQGTYSSLIPSLGSTAYINFVQQIRNDVLERWYIEVAFISSTSLFFKNGDSLEQVYKTINPGDHVLFAFIKNLRSIPFDYPVEIYQHSYWMIEMWPWEYSGDWRVGHIEGSYRQYPTEYLTAFPNRYIDGMKNYKNAQNKLVTTIPSWSEIIKYLEFYYQKRNDL